MNLEEYLGSWADIPSIVVSQREQILSGQLLLVEGEKGDFGTIPQLIVEAVEKRIFQQIPDKKMARFFPRHFAFQRPSHRAQ